MLQFQASAKIFQLEYILGFVFQKIHRGHQLWVTSPPLLPRLIPLGGKGPQTNLRGVCGCTRWPFVQKLRTCKEMQVQVASRRCTRSLALSCPPDSLAGWQNASWTIPTRSPLRLRVPNTRYSRRSGGGFCNGCAAAMEIENRKDSRSRSHRRCCFWALAIFRRSTEDRSPLTAKGSQPELVALLQRIPISGALVFLGLRPHNKYE